MAFDKASHRGLLESLSRCEGKAVRKEQGKPWGELLQMHA